MKKLIAGTLGILIFAIIVLLLRNTMFKPLQKPTVAQWPSVTNTQSNDNSATAVGPGNKQSLFVPYWSMRNEKIISNGFDQLIYFGIAPDNKGIQVNDSGYKNLQTFTSLSDQSIEKLLAVRMIEKNSNFKVLGDKSLQDRVIEQAIVLAKKHGFAGIVLDLEVVSLPFGSIVSQINTLASDFYKNAHQANLSFTLMIYGDVFSRIRPYDVKTLVGSADTIMVMAYDFHKAKGNPGPNFPLFGKEMYGYDLEVMTSDFLNLVPREKMTVVFGLFGYNWVVNDNNSIKQEAEALSYNEIQQKFLNGCAFRKCHIVRDEKSHETNIRYVDTEEKQHSVWLEDFASMEKKKMFLKEKGIHSFGVWAYSYY